MLGPGITETSTLVCCSRDGTMCWGSGEEGLAMGRMVWKCFTKGPTWSVVLRRCLLGGGPREAFRGVSLFT